MDLAITIRTCVIANGVASVQSAAGVVYDSIPERELLEHQNKARALLTAIGQVQGVILSDAKTACAQARIPCPDDMRPRSSSRPILRCMPFKLTSTDGMHSFELRDGA